MRKRIGWAAFLAICLIHAGAVPAGAGLYNTEDPGWSNRLEVEAPPFQPTPNIQQFLYVVKELFRVGRGQTALRNAYERRIAELETKRSADALTMEDRVNLAAYYIRL